MNAPQLLVRHQLSKESAFHKPKNNAQQKKTRFRRKQKTMDILHEKVEVGDRIAVTLTNLKTYILKPILNDDVSP